MSRALCGLLRSYIIYRPYCEHSDEAAIRDIDQRQEQSKQCTKE